MVSRPLVNTILCRISSRIHFWGLEGQEMAKIDQKLHFSWGRPSIGWPSPIYPVRPARPVRPPVPTVNPVPNPCITFKCPYIKGGNNTVHLSNIVKYISTRNGVQKFSAENKNLSVTKKQAELIKNILKELSLYQIILKVNSSLVFGIKDKVELLIGVK